jgi:hypothetical protein
LVDLHHNLKAWSVPAFGHRKLIFGEEFDWEKRIELLVVKIIGE